MSVSSRGNRALAFSSVILHLPFVSICFNAVDDGDYVHLDFCARMSLRRFMAKQIPRICVEQGVKIK